MPHKYKKISNVPFAIISLSIIFIPPPPDQRRQPAKQDCGGDGYQALSRSFIDAVCQCHILSLPGRASHADCPPRLTRRIAAGSLLPVPQMTGQDSNLVGRWSRPPVAVRGMEPIRVFPSRRPPVVVTSLSQTYLCRISPIQEIPLWVDICVVQLQTHD